MIKDKTSNKLLSSDCRLVLNKYPTMCRYMSSAVILKESAKCSYFFTFNINQYLFPFCLTAVSSVEAMSDSDDDYSFDTDFS